LTLRVLRVSYIARAAQNRGRERALTAAGADVTLVVPNAWPDPEAETTLSPEPFSIIELPVRRPGDENRHRQLDASDPYRLIAELKPDLLDIHSEPYSLTAREWLRATDRELPVVMYSAQNIDKRYPPPFYRYEQAALRRVGAFYPCARQVATVLRGKGFAGRIEVLALGYDAGVFSPGSQSLDADEIVLMLVGRLVPEKGGLDAVRTLARINTLRPARLVFSGQGPDAARAKALAKSLGLESRVEFRPWQSQPELGGDYRRAHVVLVPSRPTLRWVEQFGRVIVEAQASGAVVAGYANGAIPDVAGEAGVLVATGDVDGLAAGVERVIGDPQEFARRREAGFALSATRTWGAVAASQLALYQEVLAGAPVSLSLPRSPRRRRERARAEFGPSAATPAGVRPFALPLLRHGGPAVDLLGAAIDAFAELGARVAPSSSR
jgi:glycosyltransferase involved in cell wall biosynthesis